MSEPLDFIHRFLPPSHGSKRVLLLLHGTGGDEFNLFPLGGAIDPNAALLSPRGKVLENGAPRFFRRLAEGVFDQEDLIRRAHELADFVLAAATTYSFDLNNLIAVGYSNGANIAAATMMLRPEAWPAAILFRAMTSLSHPPPADLRGKRILISNGDNDPLIPAENAKQLAKLLRTAGAEVTARFWPAGHALVPEDIEATRHWLGP